MKIETRFDIGQEVAYLDFEPNKCAKCDQVTPGGSWIVREGVVGSCQVNEICYKIFQLFVLACNVFGTRAEAEAEAARRNREEA